MRRGEIWNASGGKDYAGKPRPVVILQDDSFDATNSITICALPLTEQNALVPSADLAERWQRFECSLSLDG